MYSYTSWVKKQYIKLLPDLLTDFQNSLAGRLSGVNLQQTHLNIPTHLK